jgi:hypothetical protein
LLALNFSWNARSQQKTCKQKDKKVFYLSCFE